MNDGLDASDATWPTIRANDLETIVVVGDTREVFGTQGESGGVPMKLTADGRFILPSAAHGD